jgi:Na+-transporting NADH:ubiquinone oxidoreductase subunit A
MPGVAETGGKGHDMASHVIKKGLDLPISGAPDQRIEDARQTSKVAIVAHDYPFMKPRMRVQEGDVVKRGQVLFEDRKTPGVLFTALGAGRVTRIQRGARRALQSVVIELTPSERQGKAADSDHQRFASYASKSVRSLDGSAARELLVESGLWTAIRQRPFSKVPGPEDQCHSIFVTATDSNPLAPDPEVILEGRLDRFNEGLWVLSTLTEGPIHLCRKPGSAVDGGDAPRVELHEFSGKHPAGLAGTHIHLVDPVNRSRVVWYVGYQDVVAIGELFASGRLPVERVASLAGPMVQRPRLLRTRLGTEIDPLVEGELFPGDPRVISGSVLYGHRAMGERYGYLGRYSNQISVIAENRRRQFLGWMSPGLDRFSAVPAYLSALRPKSTRYDLGTSTFGGHRAMVPINVFEKVMPLDIEPTFLLRALLVDDLERAEALGCLELDEEDLGLCSFVSPGKEDYAPALRRNLYEIWREG